MQITKRTQKDGRAWIEFTTDSGIEVYASHRPSTVLAWSVYYKPTRRSMGKHFRTREEMMGHYSSIKGELATAADMMEEDLAAAA